MRARARGAVPGRRGAGERRARRAALCGSVLAAAALVAPPGASAQEEGDNARGKAVYDQWCSGCHGVEGDGQGPAAHYMLPRPRDFTRAMYQVRTTPSGEVPTDEDLMHVIDVGMPNTAMPGWEDVLTRAEREALVPYLKSFSRFFRPGESPTPMEFGRAAGGGDEAVARGAELYQRIECWQCHGQAGRGDGTSAPTLEDDAGQPIYAADLTKNWTFNGGGRVEDIYRRLRTGLDGTPMPTFDDLITAGIVTEEGLWDLAHYVRSLSPQRAPETREVIRAARLEEGELPASVDDERWADVDRFYVPLVGQIVVEPRWFTPRVNNLWVRALHDGERLALLVSWSDPSRSPAPAWSAFAQRVQAAMEPVEGEPWAPGAPDQLVVQFPQTESSGMERPYFLQGDTRRPTYLWRWRSDPEGAAEVSARGLGTGIEQEAASQQLTSVSGWADGEWRVLLSRSLATPDSGQDLQLPLARAVPVAFQAWDGDNGESGNRAAVSTWYFLALEESVPVTVFVAPALAVILTAGLGLLVVARAQKREREGGVA